MKRRLKYLRNGFFLKKILFIHERQAETHAEGEAGSMQETRCGTPSRVFRITLRAEGAAKPLGYWGCPIPRFKKEQNDEEMEL